jgi:hypothetical protein
MFAVVFKCFSSVFTSVSDLVPSVLQLLHLHISALDRMLHLGCALQAASGLGDLRGGERRLERRGQRPIHAQTTAGVLAHELDALGARSLPFAGTVRTLGH